MKDYLFVGLLGKRIDEEFKGGKGMTVSELSNKVGYPEGTVRDALRFNKEMQRRKAEGMQLFPKNTLGS